MIIHSLILQLVSLLHRAHGSGRELRVRQGPDLVPGQPQVHQGVHHYPRPRPRRQRPPYPGPGTGQLRWRL